MAFDPIDSSASKVAAIVNPPWMKPKISCRSQRRLRRQFWRSQSFDAIDTLEASPRALDVLRRGFNPDPVSRKGFGRCAGCVAAGEGIKYQVSGYRQKANEKLGEIHWHPCRMGAQIVGATILLIRIHVVSVRDSNHIRWNGPAMIFQEGCFANAVLRRPQPGVVFAPLQELL